MFLIFWAERFSLIFYTSASKEKQLRPADLYEKFKLALLRMVNDGEFKKKKKKEESERPGIKNK